MKGRQARQMMGEAGQGTPPSFSSSRLFQSMNVSDLNPPQTLIGACFPGNPSAPRVVI